MIMKNRISVSEVAELMNVSEQFIRIGLQKGIFPFGYAVKMSTQCNDVCQDIAKVCEEQVEETDLQSVAERYFGGV